MVYLSIGCCLCPKCDKWQFGIFSFCALLFSCVSAMYILHYVVSVVFIIIILILMLMLLLINVSSRRRFVSPSSPMFLLLAFCCCSVHFVFWLLFNYPKPTATSTHNLLRSTTIWRRKKVTCRLPLSLSFSLSSSPSFSIFPNFALHCSHTHINQSCVCVRMCAAPLTKRTH